MARKVKLTILMVDGSRYVIGKVDHETVLDLIEDLQAAVPHDDDVEHPRAQTVHLEMDDARDHWWQRRRPVSVHMLRRHVLAVEVE